MKTELSILSFSDYRAFLAAHAQDMRRKNPRWSLGAWTRRLGLKTTSSLSKVINGERNPGEAMSKKMIDYFDFNNEETCHFRDLILLHKLARNPEMSVRLLDKLESARTNADYSRVDEATFSVLSEWYCYAVREMVQLEDFLEDPDWISKKLQFSVPTLDVSKAITKLLRCGLLQRDAKGRLKLAQPRIDTSNDVACEAIRRFHEQALDNAKQAIRTVAVENRELTASTFAIDPKDLPRAKEMIRKFRTSFARTFERTNAKQVYQLELAFYPLTRGN